MEFVVLCSSNGTVFQSVLDRIKEGSLRATCLGLITDRSDRGCIQKAQAAGVGFSIVEHHENETREEYDKRLSIAMKYTIEGSDNVMDDPEFFVACMGWMYMLSPWFVKTWHNRILNVHPALLPKYPGTHAHELVLENKDTESGMTIHLIDEGMDTGKILLQKKCPVLPDDTEKTLKKRVQALECEWYPKVLQMIEDGSIKV